MHLRGKIFRKFKFSVKKSGLSENSSGCRRWGRNLRKRTSKCWSNRRWNRMPRSSINKDGGCWTGNTTTLHASTAPPSNRTMMRSISSIPKPKPELPKKIQWFQFFRFLSLRQFFLFLDFLFKKINNLWEPLFQRSHQGFSCSWLGTDLIKF